MTHLTDAAYDFSKKTNNNRTCTVLLSIYSFYSIYLLNIRQIRVCNKWHWIFFDTTGRLVADPEFVCQRCRGVAYPIDGRPVTHVDVDGTQLDVEATFCYLGDMFSAGGGCDRAIGCVPKVFIQALGRDCRDHSDYFDCVGI